MILAVLNISVRQTELQSAVVAGAFYNKISSQMTAHSHVGYSRPTVDHAEISNEISDLGALVATPRCDDGDAKNAGLNNDTY